MNRRDFMKSTVMATAATAVAGRRASATPAPSDRLRVGFIGCGARAQQLMQAVVGMPDLEVVGLCDAYTGRLDRARARTGGKAVVYKDYRELLSSSSVDAVFIATPDHWHKTMAIDAVSANKDVYLEKPMTFAIADGQAIVDAVGRSRRILQVGSQGISSAATAKARELIKAGALGQVTMVRAAYNRNGDSGAWLYPIPPDASPSTVNWEQFLGPAPKRPFDLNRFFRWRCYWDYSGGIATDLFVHLVTEYHHALDLKAPSTVMAAGANYRYKATHEVPDTINALLMYPEGLTASLTCTFNNADGTASGLEILGTKGSLALRDGGVTFTPETGHDDNRWVVSSWAEEAERKYYEDPKVQAVESPWLQAGHLRGGTESWRSDGRDDDYTHIANFVASVKTRTQPVEDASFGHRAAACAHMVNQSIREKRIIEWQS
jgi:predicted dehydrogenase